MWKYWTGIVSAESASKYTDMHIVFTMVYLAVAHQYIHICVITLVCLTCRWTSTTRGYSHTQLYDWPFWVYPQPRLTCMTNCSAGYLTRGHLYLTCRSLCIPVKANITHVLCDNSSEANQCLLKLKLLKLHGDTDTPLYLSDYREIPTLPSTLPSVEVDIKADLASAFSACTEPNSYSTLS